MRTHIARTDSTDNTDITSRIKYAMNGDFETTKEKRGAICVVRMGDGLEGRDEGEEDIRSIKGRASTSLT